MINTEYYGDRDSEMWLFPTESRSETDSLSHKYKWDLYCWQNVTIGHRGLGHAHVSAWTHFPARFPACTKSFMLLLRDAGSAVMMMMMTDDGVEQRRTSTPRSCTRKTKTLQKLIVRISTHYVSEPRCQRQETSEFRFYTNELWRCKESTNPNKRSPVCDLFNPCLAS